MASRLDEGCPVRMTECRDRLQALLTRELEPTEDGDWEAAAMEAEEKEAEKRWERAGGEKFFRRFATGPWPVGTPEEEAAYAAGTKKRPAMKGAKKKFAPVARITTLRGNKVESEVTVPVTFPFPIPCPNKRKPAKKSTRKRST